MEEFNIQGKQTSFYKYCPGTFGYTLVYIYEVVSKIFQSGATIYTAVVVAQNTS